MKLRFLVISAIIICLFLSGCSYDDNIEMGELLENVSSQSIDDTTDDTDIVSGGSLRYSELSGNIDTEKYYTALANTDGRYFILEEDGQKYLLAVYNFYGYGSRISDIKKVDKKYDGDTLTVIIDADISYFDSMGDEPEISRIECSLVLDRDVSSVMIGLENMEQDYYPYEGGIILKDDKYGVVDDALNEIVPAEYEHIMEWGYNPTESTFYYTRKNDANGLMDAEFNEVLSNSYSNILIVNENKFIAMRNYDEEDRNYEIILLDGDENELGPSIRGFIDAYQIFNNPAKQAIFGRYEGDNFYEGVLDEDLNVIIEPTFISVEMFNYSEDNQFYVVENADGEFAVYDCNGDKKTEFENTSVYDVQTKYGERYSFK